MNPKNSLSMNRYARILAFALLFLGVAAAGQPRYERVYKDNFWNGSRNVTGLRQDNVSRSYAEVYGSYKSGEFRDTWEAEKAWSAGARTASIRHHDRISFAGSFGFDQTEGYGMCGSMFIKPGFYPVDVLEFTPGRKTLQTYSFDGGVSYDVAGGWRIGAKMDFESANIAKRKDLRHENKRLEMAVAPGFMYHSGDFAIGANYIFEKTSETIEAEQVGTAESSYWAFLDKGLMYGVHSVWTGSGIHLDEVGVNGFPVSDFSNGIALQAQYRGLFAEVEYLSGRGRVGEKEYVWFEFPGNEFGAQLGYTFNDRVARHKALVRFGRKGLGLDENVLEKVTENGVNTVINHGSNRILAREIISLSPEYEITTPYFELMAGADLEWTGSLASQMYPYVYGQRMFVYTVKVGMLLTAKRWDFSARVHFGGGRVSEEKRMAAEGAGVLGEPFRLEEWYQESIGYQTSPKTLSCGAVRYKFQNGIYLEAAYDILNRGLNFFAPEEMYPRSEVKLKLGYNF